MRKKFQGLYDVLKIKSYSYGTKIYTVIKEQKASSVRFNLKLIKKRRKRFFFRNIVIVIKLVSLNEYFFRSCERYSHSQEKGRFMEKPSHKRKKYKFILIVYPKAFLINTKKRFSKSFSPSALIQKVFFFIKEKNKNTLNFALVYEKCFREKI